MYVGTSDKTVKKHMEDLRSQDFWPEEEIDKAKTRLDGVICYIFIVTASRKECPILTNQNS